MGEVVAAASQQALVHLASTAYQFLKQSPPIVSPDKEEQKNGFVHRDIS
jgi:hypothetical protein